jgi:hypothetical protein
VVKKLAKNKKQRQYHQVSGAVPIKGAMTCDAHPYSPTRLRRLNESRSAAIPALQHGYMGRVTKQQCCHVSSFQVMLREQKKQDFEGT